MIIQLQNDTTTVTLYNHTNYKTTQLQISIKNMTLPSEKSMPSSHHPCYDTLRVNYHTFQYSCPWTHKLTNMDLHNRSSPNLSTFIKLSYNRHSLYLVSENSIITKFNLHFSFMLHQSFQSRTHFLYWFQISYMYNCKYKTTLTGRQNPTVTHMIRG